MSARSKPSDSEGDSEGDTEKSHETVKELEALIAKEKSKLDESRQKTKLISLKKKLTELRKETLAEQRKRDCETGFVKNESKTVTRKDEQRNFATRPA